MSKPIIICVDDEKIIVDSLKAEIKSAFKDQLIVETAESGNEAIEIIEECKNRNIKIPIVVSDWLMPQMKGDELLAKVHRILPDTKKILLTGQVTTIGLGNAINDAKLYRFIPKPWNAEDLELTLTEAFKSYYHQIQLNTANQKLKDINTTLEQLICERTAELEESNRKNQVLLDQTLFGSVNTLIKILMKSNPDIFSKAFRIRQITKRIIKHISISNIWEIEIASLFSQLGCLDLPQDIVTKKFNNLPLTQQELDVFKLHSEKTYELISSIPVFGNISLGIKNHLSPTKLLTNDDSYHISAILKIATDFDEAMQGGLSEQQAIEVLRVRHIHYDKELLNCLILDIYDNNISINHNDKIREISLNGLRVGYVLAKDITDMDGKALFKAEQEITHSLINDILNSPNAHNIKEPICVYNYLLV